MFSLVAHVATGAGSTSGAVNDTGADLTVIIANGGGSNSGVVGLPADTVGNIYLTSFDYDDGANIDIELFYLYNPIVSSSKQFTPLNAVDDLTAASFNGARTTSDPFNSASGQALIANVTSMQPGGGTPGLAGNLVVTGLANGGTGNTYPSGWTGIDIRDYLATGFRLGGGMAWAIGAGVSANPTWNWSVELVGEQCATQGEFFPAPPPGGGTVSVFEHHYRSGRA